VADILIGICLLVGILLAERLEYARLIREVRKVAGPGRAKGDSNGAQGDADTRQRGHER
jgi:hypothetical protein